MFIDNILDNNEKCGKNDMTELFGRVKRYEEEARIDNDEVRQALTRNSQTMDERLLRDKVSCRIILTLSLPSIFIFAERVERDAGT